VRSIFGRILLWFGGILLFSIAAFWASQVWLNPRNPAREGVFRRMMDYHLEEVVESYQSGGAVGLKAILGKLDEKFPGHHYLVDQTGKDLVTGEDRSAILRAPESWRRPPLPPPSTILIKRASPDGRYHLLVENHIQTDYTADLLTFGWIVVVIVLLCYVLAVRFARPVRTLREAVVRFGDGDLSTRTRFTRKDEIGDLSRSFDQMADRIQTLLTAERRLLQDVSHELRSPLARLGFAIELARTSPDRETALGRIKKEVDRMSTLVSELLQVTRAEGDPQSQNLTAIDLRAFLQSLINDCAVEAQNAGCHVELLVKDKATWNGDRELLHRAVENVLRNALRFAPPGSTVDVALHGEAGQIVVSVRDYGPGVPDEMLPQIFRPFVRVEADRSRNGGGGVGLGLAIAERAIRVHHGEIVASNMNPGLLVQMKLPRQDS
jgi:signal transduction histidine kinase